MKAFARPFSTSFRHYSSQTASKSAPLGVTKDVKLDRLPNGLLLATLENHCPVSRVALMYNAGSRNEDHFNRGITHYIRTMASMSSKKATGFGISRNIQQIGATLSCSTTREQTLYAVEFLRDKFDVALENLAHVATAPAFKHWEVSDILPRLSFEAGHFENNLQARLVEMIHQVAYRETLGNSLYIQKHNIGSINKQQLEEFVKTHFLRNNAVMVGMGVDHEELNHFARRLFPNVEHKEPVSQIPSSFYSGEIRHEVKSPLAFISAVTEGMNLSDPDLIALSLLQCSIGITPHLKYSSNQVNHLYKVASLVAKQPFAISCINSSYTDSGLFGLKVVCEAKDANQIMKASVGVMNHFAKGKITNQELAAAKANLKANVAFHDENSRDALEVICQEVLLTGQLLSKQQVNSAIDRVTLDDVVRVSKKVITGTPSMAAIGDLSHTPHLDELFG